jgi:transposase InsO family protein
VGGDVAHAHAAGVEIQHPLIEAGQPGLALITVGRSTTAGSSSTSPSTTAPASPTPKVLGDEKATTAAAFLRRAIAFFKRHGITVERVMTDNGSAYRSTLHAIACRALGLRHLRTRPYRPQTNGKAERFIRTLQTEWAYATAWTSNDQRTAALDSWLTHYNTARSHSALGGRPPISRIAA